MKFRLLKLSQNEPPLSLTESLATMVDIASRKDLADHLEVSEADIQITFYDIGPDPKTGWGKTFLVSITEDGIIGMSNGDVI